jgi:DNA-binding phage protein
VYIRKNLHIRESTATMKLFLHISDKGKTETYLHEILQEDAIVENLITEVLSILKKVRNKA